MLYFSPGASNSKRNFLYFFEVHGLRYGNFLISICFLCRITLAWANKTKHLPIQKKEKKIDSFSFWSKPDAYFIAHDPFCMMQDIFNSMHDTLTMMHSAWCMMHQNVTSRLKDYLVVDKVHDAKVKISIEHHVQNYIEAFVLYM